MYSHLREYPSTGGIHLPGSTIGPVNSIGSSHHFPAYRSLPCCTIHITSPQPCTTGSKHFVIQNNQLSSITTDNLRVGLNLCPLCTIFRRVQFIVSRTCSCRSIRIVCTKDIKFIIKPGSTVGVKRRKPCQGHIGIYLGSRGFTVIFALHQSSHVIRTDCIIEFGFQFERLCQVNSAFTTFYFGIVGIYLCPDCSSKYRNNPGKGRRWGSEQKAVLTVGNHLFYLVNFTVKNPSVG
ncbi:hypothetical protein SDC9_135966 [bioreactor metagenome]|uniref:Uncharacterized protein n=1 Tax=bioreactor metagenome TaxID=1076179 RepID=A0A645DJW5_9ZZZZ